MLTLYYAPGTCALASFVALEEAGLPFTPRKINTAQGEQRSADYLAVNPKGRVPALATDMGVLTETPAILAYIAALAPAAHLAPADAFAFAQMQAFNSYLCSTVHINHAHGRRGMRWSDDTSAIESMKAKVPQTMTECFELIEETMFKGPWVMGEQYTVADPYLFTMTGWLRGDGVDPMRFRKATAHYASMMERPGVQRALEREQA